jgi:putative IMPACT (imprinted ancient) family translation regulator
VGGGDSIIEHCSDDGEPSGTAGRPALSVLRGSGLGDVAIVITRYFGGTQLGTGGLVRAYSEAVRMVVEAVPRAEKVPTYTVILDLPYRLFERVRLLTRDHAGEILEEIFGGEVSLIARFPVERLDDFQAALGELSNGSLQAEIIETVEVLMHNKL